MRRKERMEALYRVARLDFRRPDDLAKSVVSKNERSVLASDRRLEHVIDESSARLPRYIYFRSKNNENTIHDIYKSIFGYVYIILRCVDAMCRSCSEHHYDVPQLSLPSTTRPSPSSSVTRSSCKNSQRGRGMSDNEEGRSSRKKFP